MQKSRASLFCTLCAFVFTGIAMGFFVAWSLDFYPRETLSAGFVYIGLAILYAFVPGLGPRLQRLRRRKTIPPQPVSSSLR